MDEANQEKDSTHPIYPPLLSFGIVQISNLIRSAVVASECPEEEEEEKKEKIIEDTYLWLIDFLVDIEIEMIRATKWSCHEILQLEKKGT